jgi:hypothetical protein
MSSLGIPSASQVCAKGSNCVFHSDQASRCVCIIQFGLFLFHDGAGRDFIWPLGARQCRESNKRGIYF